MAVRYILSFDGFGEGATADGYVINGRGLLTHPAKPTFSTSGRNSYASGVSGKAAHKFGNGATLRNAMAMTSMNDGTAAVAMSVVFPLAVNVIPSIAGSTTYLGVRMKRIRASASAEISSFFPLIGLSSFDVLTYNPNTKNFAIPNATTMSAVPFDMVVGQEYYIELEIKRTSSGSASFAIFVDGVELGRFTNAKSVSVITSLRIGSSTSYNTSWMATMLYGDIYIGDERLGPQMILTRQPTRTLESNWIPSEGNDPLALLTGENADNDAKFITSPLDNAPDRYRMDFSLPEGYRAHSAELYVRAKRSAGSDRTVSAAVSNVLTNEEIAADNKIATTYGQNQFDTAKVWSTGASEDLVPANINNLAMTLSSPKV